MLCWQLSNTCVGHLSAMQLTLFTTKWLIGFSTRHRCNWLALTFCGLLSPHRCQCSISRGRLSFNEITPSQNSPDLQGRRFKQFVPKNVFDFLISCASIPQDLLCELVKLPPPLLTIYWAKVSQRTPKKTFLCRFPMPLIVYSAIQLHAEVVFLKRGWNAPHNEIHMTHILIRK